MARAKKNKTRFDDREDLTVGEILLPKLDPDRQLLFLKYLLEICTESQKNEKEMYTE